MEEGALLSPIALGVFVCGGLARFHLAGNGVDGCIPAHRHVGTAAQASLGKVPFQTAAQVSGTGADRVQPLDDIALSVEDLAVAVHHDACLLYTSDAADEL